MIQATYRACRCCGRALAGDDVRRGRLACDDCLDAGHSPTCVQCGRARYGAGLYCAACLELGAPPSPRPLGAPEAG